MTAARVSRHLTLCLADDSHTVLLAESPEGELLGHAAVHWLPYLFLAGPEGRGWIDREDMANMVYEL